MFSAKWHFKKKYLIFINTDCFANQTVEKIKLF